MTSAFTVNRLVDEHNRKRLWDVMELMTPFLVENYIWKSLEMMMIALSSPLLRLFKRSIKCVMQGWNLRRAKRSTLEVCGDEPSCYGIMVKSLGEATL